MCRCPDRFVRTIDVPLRDNVQTVRKGLSLAGTAIISIANLAQRYDDQAAGTQEAH